MTQNEKIMTPEKKKVRRVVRRGPNSVDYVDNAKFLEEIKLYKAKFYDAKKNGKEAPRLNSYLGDCIMKIANRLASMPKFYGYSFREEMISDAIENCILYFDRFDETKYSNPFAYYTQIVKWAFLRRILKEEKNRYTIYKSFEEHMLNSSNADYLLDSDDNSLLSPAIYDNILEYIDNFEKKEVKRKEKVAASKEGILKYGSPKKQVRKPAPADDPGIDHKDLRSDTE